MSGGKPLFLTSSIQSCAKEFIRLVVIDPAARNEFSFGRIDRKNVRTHRSDATVWSKGDAWGHAGVVLVQALKRSDQFLAAQISSGSLQPFCEDLRRRVSIQL